MTAPKCCIECDETWREQLPEGDVRALFRSMIVCETCGNKRCPKATKHWQECTGSNEPGQPGSAYAIGRHLRRVLANRDPTSGGNGGQAT